MSRSLLPAALLLILLLGQSVRADVPTVESMLANLRQSSLTADRVGFQQQIELRALFLSWRFSADVTKEGDHYSVVVGDGAPGFMPQDLPATLVNVQESIHLFDLTFVGTETDSSGRTLYVVEGVRKDPSNSGVQSGKLWVDGSDWYIAQAHLAYTWGRLEVEQVYRREQGHIVLDRQSAIAHPLGARVEVKYHGYWFGDR